MSEIKISTDNAEAAKSIFSDLQNKRDLLDQRASGAVSARRIFAHVQGQKDEAVERLIRSNLNAQRLYRKLLKEQAYFHIPQAIAASSEEFPERYCDGCKIRLQVSRAQSDQLYLIVEIADQRRQMPQTLTLFGDGETCEILDLPAARNGVIQTIIDRHSLLAKLLADPKSETFLR